MSAKLFMIKQLFFASFFLFLFTGCAIKNRYAAFAYSPAHLSNHLSTGVPLSLEVRDERKIEDVGYIQNTLGMKTARILPKQKVSSILYDALEKVFLERGFKVESSSLKVLVIINKCFTDYDISFLGERAVANLDLTLHIVDSNEQLLYFKKITTQGIESPIFIYHGKNASKALNKALSRALQELREDRYLFYTLNSSL